MSNNWFETSVKIFDSRFKASYPKDNVHIDNMGYFVINNIPLFYQQIKKKDQSNSKISDKVDNTEIFFTSILFTKKHFPVYCFNSRYIASINIKSKNRLSHNYLLSKVVRIIEGKYKIPILYNPYNENISYDEAQDIIKKIRIKSEYIDFFHLKNIPIGQQINKFSNSYEFSSFTVDVKSFKAYYLSFINCSRFIHIALHYYLNAARLINNDFIEDAGINLQLVVEAIIKDFMQTKSIKNKKYAIEKLFEIELKLDEDLTDWFMELYEARNEFLAHIDEGMFTSNQRINDPDGYCFDHYEDIGDLILKYARYKNTLLSTIQT